MRNCLGEHTAVSHPMGLNFLLAHIISSGSCHFCFVSCFRTCVSIRFATPEVVTELITEFLFYLGFFINGKSREGKGIYGARGGKTFLLKV